VSYGYAPGLENKAIMHVVPVVLTSLVFLGAQASAPTEPSSPASPESKASEGQEKPSNQEGAAPATPKKDLVDADAVLRRVTDMQPAQQQAWLKDIEERLDRACRAALNPKDAQKKVSGYRTALHQKVVPWDKLRELVRETDQREKAAIARLWALYRIQVYETFWGQPKYHQRQEAATRVLQAWAQAGQPFMEQGKLVAWLEEAVKNSTRATVGPLPDDPLFQSDQSPDSLMLAEPSPATKPEPKQSDTQGKKKAGQEKSPLILQDLPR